MAEVVQRCARFCRKFGWVVEDDETRAQGISCHYTFSRGNKVVMYGSHFARVVREEEQEEDESEGEAVSSSSSSGSSASASSSSRPSQRRVKTREIHVYHLLVEKHDLQGVTHLLSAGGLTKERFQQGFRNSLVEFQKSKFAASMRYLSQDLVEDETLELSRGRGWYTCRCFERHWHDRYSQDLPTLHHDALNLTVDMGFYANAWTIVLHQKDNYWVQYKRFTTKSLRAANETMREWIGSFPREESSSHQLVAINFDELEDEEKKHFPSVFGGLPF